MELIALRYVFSGKNSFGKPTGDHLKVFEKEDGQFVTEADGLWEIKTHDRGDNLEDPSHKYFQITFRLLGTMEEKKAYKILIKTDLVQKRQLEYDAENDLWYQKTWFNNKGLPVLGEHYVDSITSAGVFEVQVVNITTGISEITRTVHVLPSSISKVEYQTMIKKLIEIHERIITSSSMVGIGKIMTLGSIHKNYGEWDYELWQEMKPLVEKIMKMPSEMLRKDYSKITKEKIKRFDSKVICSFSQKEGSQSIDGIVYLEDYDTYENRILKFFLQKLSQRYIATPIKMINIEKNLTLDLQNKFYRVDIKSLFCPLLVSDHSLSNKRNEEFRLEIKNQRKFYTSGKERSLQIETSYNKKIKTFTIRTNNTRIKSFLFYPFMYDMKDCGIVLETTFADVALRFIESIIGLYGDLDDKDIPSDGVVIIKGCGGLKLYNVDDYDIKSAYFLELTDFDSITTSWTSVTKRDPIKIPQKMVLAGYLIHLENIRSLYRINYIQICDYPQEVVDFIVSRVARYQKVLKLNNIRKKQRKAQSEMRSLVHDEWFYKIQQLNHVELPIKSTPKFSHNKFYRRIYDLLQRFIEFHPLLTNDFDSNAFGLKETWQIYEYWVFSEVLNRLLNLGFQTISDTSSIRNSLNDFFFSTGHPEGFHVLLEKKSDDVNDDNTIEMIFGYNCQVGCQQDKVKGSRHYTPDIFFRIKHKKAYHWYFIDAKYNVYEKGSKTIAPKDLYGEIYDVAIYKYIHRMAEEGFLNIMTNQKSEDDPILWNVEIENKIKGAYIIVANIINENEKSDSRIADNDRLFGGNVSLANKYEHPDRKKYVPFKEFSDGRKYYPSVDDDNGYPRHRYGAIQFRPGYEDELTSLLEMIFEYKETEDSGLLEDFGEKKSSPTNLNLCWDSTFDHSEIHPPRIDTRMTIGGKYKFSVTCKCGAQRYENHCLKKHGIIKHNLNSYHCRLGYDPKTTEFHDRWNYVCPVCGEDL